MEKDPLVIIGNENTDSYKNILTTPAVYLLAFFILFYVGAEVTTGGTNAGRYNNDSVSYGLIVTFFLFYIFI